VIAPNPATIARPARAASRRGERIRTIVRLVVTYGFLLVFAITMVGPFLLMVSASLQPNLIYLTFPMPLIGPDMGFGNYVSLFSRSLIGRWILNSAAITVSVTLLQIITCSMSGYAFARGKFFGRDFIFWIFMGTLMIPSTVTIIPLYIVVSALGWGNTFPGLIIPQATSIFGTFLMRQNFKSIPTEYDDAARIDGANRWQFFLQVLLPLTKPALATLGTLTFLDSWNDFLYPLIVTSSDQMYPLTVGLATMVKRGGNAGFSLAGATVSFLPTFIFFLFMQRYVVRGITLSGLKG
jgi:ABC-type glycerol-3-phosphate transport system permease component